MEFKKSIDEMKTYLKPINIFQTLRIASTLIMNKISRKLGK